MKIMIAGSIRLSAAVCAWTRRLRRTRPRCRAWPAARRWIRPTSIMSIDKAGKILVWRRRLRERLPFPHHLHRLSAAPSLKPRTQRIGRGIQRLQQRNAADEQRAQHARKLRHLILQPDLARHRNLQQKPVDQSRVRVRCPRPPAEHEDSSRPADELRAARNCGPWCRPRSGSAWAWAAGRSCSNTARRNSAPRR